MPAPYGATPLPLPHPASSPHPGHPADEPPAGGPAHRAPDPTPLPASAAPASPSSPLAGRSWPGGEEFELPGRPTSVAAAREEVCRRLDDWDVSDRARDTARLVVSELVTNALLHTASERIVCRLDRVRRSDPRPSPGQRLRIEVADQGPGLTPRAPRTASTEAEGGRGLLLLDALAEQWGVISPDRAGRCTVWAELLP